jgi:hypothetical protein
MTSENRKLQPRLPAYMAAKIVVPGQRAFPRCVVRQISPAGAKLEVNSNWVLPSRFWLHIDGDTRMHYCVVVWMDGTNVGVDFRPDQRSTWWKQSRELNQLPHRDRV